MVESCVVCRSRRLERQVTATGPRAYCLDCFHGWRTAVDPFPYDSTSMCPLGTGADRLRGQIDFFGPWIAAGAAVLEIGCATGELARAVRAALPIGRYEAIELSPAGERARPVLDELHTVPLQRLRQERQMDGRFDAILISHVLEHLERPRDEIEAMVRVLAPGGTIFVEVPNGSGHRRLPIDDNRSHLHFFSATSLMRLLAEAGLDTVAVATGVRLDARYADSLQAVAKPFVAPIRTPDLLSDHASLKGVDDLIVWGAGSLVDEVLANFFDARRIDFFIDRDPGKVGGERLGRPVRGPEALPHEARTILVNSIDFAPSIIADIRASRPGVPHRTVPIGDLLAG